MKDFKPSDDFVSRVMADIDAYEASSRFDIAKAELLQSSRLVRYILSAGGIALSIVNIFRIISSYISPALCR